MSILRSMRAWPDRLADIVASPGKAVPRQAPHRPAGAESRRASAADVAFAYILFMGREAETDAIVQERVDQTAPEMLTGFIDSDEFRTLIDRIVAGGGIAAPVFREHPAADLVRWAAEYFGLAGRATRKALAGRPLLYLLAAVLAAPMLRDPLETSFGRERAAGLPARLRRAAAAIPTKRFGRGAAAARKGVAAEDVCNLYLLILDRAPETSFAARARLNESLVDCVVQFLTSREFGMAILAAALDRRFGDGVPLAPELRQWVAAAFQLALGAQADRQEAIVALLTQPVVRERLRAAPPLWSVDEIVRALAIAPETMPEELDQSASLRRLLERSGLFDRRWYLAHNPDLRGSDLKDIATDPLVHFVHSGAHEGRDPGPDFDTAYYREQHPEIETAGVSPIEHYLRIGRPAGAAGKGPSAYERWLARFDDLTPADRERIEAIAALGPMPPILWLELARDAGAAEPDRVRRMVAGQVGAAPDLRVVAPGSGVPPASALDGIAADTIVIVAGEGALLRPHACFAFTGALARGGADLAYADHDHVAPDGRRARPVFKPAMSPDFMARLPYAGPVVAVRLEERGRERLARAIVDASAGNAATALATLLLDADPARVARVPLPLFSLPEADGAADELPPRFEPGGRMTAEQPRLPADVPHVSILIPTRDRRDLLEACIDSILARTDYPAARFDIVVIDNGSCEPETIAYLDALAAGPACSVTPSPGGFNFARICNDGAARARGDVLVFLNNDMTVNEPDWLATLVHHAIRPEIGVVGAQLLYPDDTIQHGGVIMGLQGVGGHRLIGVSAVDAAGFDVTREMTAVTGACLAIRRALFEEQGGFDEVLGVAFNDVALCARMIQAGLRNLYVARPLLYHHESRSRGRDDTSEKLARNAREAIYVRERFGALFQDDPAYSPNLSLQKAGALAVPPRVIRPWRRDPPGRHVLLVSVGHGLGHGVGWVVAMQAERFVRQGWTVSVGGPVTPADREYPGCRRVALATAEEAAAFAVTAGVDLIVAHTPPFFSVVRYLGRQPLVYAYDHGEPPPELFADRNAREAVDWEKRLCMPLARRVIAISRAIRDQQFHPGSIVLRNGNGHLATWSADWAERRADLRRRFGFEDRFVVLSVCRFLRAERAYKGVDDYIAMAAELPYFAPALAGRAIFALAGRGEDKDVAFARAAGLTVFANVSDEGMAELYAASDLYVSLSRWEGYNLGIGQALAMGLDVVASDIPAHREFGVPVAGAVPELCRAVAGAFARRDDAAAARRAWIDDWDEPLRRLIDLAEADLAAEVDAPWF